MPRWSAGWCGATSDLQIAVQSENGQVIPWILGSTSACVLLAAGGKHAVCIEESVMSKKIICLGELLLRLGSPGRELLLQSPHFDVHVGGAEANVAVSLARFGHRSAVVSVVPDNALGQAAVGELRRHGVEVSAIARSAAGRMGLYFIVTGAMQRPSEVIYDRAWSSFALTSADTFDWNLLFEDADAFHVSGVTPAVGAQGTETALRASKAAREHGLFNSFDGNFRAKLWNMWNGDAAAITRELMAHADLVFADHRDIAIALGNAGSDADPEAAIRAAAERAFAAFPQLGRLCTTIRSQHSVDHHSLSAIMLCRKGEVHITPRYELMAIVDRIGGGDAFAAGVLHGLRSGMDDQASLRFGLGAACLKHSVPGDFNLVGVDDVAAWVGEGRLDVRR
jgi:2-dehydro-3-deoxygluconokinase